METEIQKIYENMCNNPSDINEHLPTLYKYATECESILETGVRGCISSWAFVYGLLNNNRIERKILLNDIDKCDIELLLKLTKNENIKIEYQWINNLELILETNYDMIFIDTWHIYGQLKRELEKFSKRSNKYIIMHDTTVDEIYGESVRCGWDIHEQSIQSGYPVEEIKCGIWKAVVDFLCNNEDWILKERFMNNNGLTILERKGI